jgi:phage-related protein
MATFPAINPTYGAEKRSAPKRRVVQFGDGYEQRLTYG